MNFLEIMGLIFIALLIPVAIFWTVGLLDIRVKVSED